MPLHAPGILYSTARREGYGVLAMAQHLDDCAESFLMSALHNGSLRSMKAHYTVDAQDLRVIRPLVLVRETEAEAFAEGANLPIVAENCPACFDAPKERYRVKCLLATQAPRPTRGLARYTVQHTLAAVPAHACSHVLRR